MKLRMIPALTLSTLALGATLFLVGCQPKGPAEKMGESIDQGVDNAADAIDPRGPAEKAGDKIDDAINR